MPPLGSLGHSGPVSRELSGKGTRETGLGGMDGKLKEAVGRTRAQRACRERPRTPRGSDHTGIETDGERSGLRPGEPSGSGPGPKAVALL